MMQRHLRACVACAALLLACASLSLARSRKGDKFFKDAEAAELVKDWDKALDLYQKAVDESPGDANYLINMRRARFQAGQMHVDRGEKLRSEGKLEEAIQEFQTGLIADPGSAIAVQDYKQTRQMIERARQPGAKASDIGLTAIEKARKDTEDRIATILSVPELKPTQVVPPLKMNNQSPRVLFETVGKIAGINVLFDSTFSGRNTAGFNVDLNSSSVEQAFDYLALLTRTFWKAISPNTIFVTEDNPTKRRDYEDNVMKVFYVTNTTTVQEFQEIAQAVRTVPEARRTFTYNAQKAIIVRGTADQVAMAEKLIHDLDKPKSEVVVDVIVMEANSSHTRDLAASLLAGSTSGLSIPFVFTPRNPVLTGGTAAAGSTPPQIRASDGQKAQLNIGDRIPYATGSFQPGVGSVGVSPLVQTQFNFVDTGVNVDITPYVHSAEEVTLHVDINVSTVRDRIDLGGVSQPIIGQRKAVADIRLREGEVSILGGLTQLQDSQTVNGIPGLVNIPILGKLFFGSQSIDKERAQLLIALIPHIVRTPDYTNENVRGIGVGNDSTIRLNYAPREPAAAPAPVVPAGGPQVPPGPAQPEGLKPPVPMAVPSITQPQIPGQTSTLGATLPVPGVPPPAAGMSPAPTAGDAAKVSFQPGSLQAQLSGVVGVNLQLENVTDLFAVTSLKLKFDPAVLKLNDVTPGELITREGGRVTSVKEIHNETGEALLTVTRLEGSKGVTGSGALATLNFIAVGKGSTKVQVTELGLKNTQSVTVAAALGELPVTVQ